MRITVGNIRRLIRETLAEAGGGITVPKQPMSTDPMQSSIPDREQLGRISVRDADDPDDLAPHLREPLEDREDCYGPVPPNAENPYATPDPYTSDFSVLPTSTIRR